MAVSREESQGTGLSGLVDWGQPDFHRFLRRDDGWQRVPEYPSTPLDWFQTCFKAWPLPFRHSAMEHIHTSSCQSYYRMRPGQSTIINNLTKGKFGFVTFISCKKTTWIAQKRFGECLRYYRRAMLKVTQY